MRQRKVKDLEQRMEQVNDYIIKDPSIHKGKWKEAFSQGGELYLEIGCGKGQFLLQHASSHPSNNYLGIEGQQSVILKALEKARDAGEANIKFTPLFVRDICDFFESGELAGIYLNFSDPWPKARHAKRRLTHSNLLKKYLQIIQPGGFIEIKTDNDDLYFFTLEQAEEAGILVKENTMDLHSSSYSARIITTEYEDKFCKEGEKINYIRL